MDIKETILNAFYNKETGLTRNLAKLKSKNPELYGISNKAIRSVLDNYTEEYQKTRPFKEVKNFVSYSANYVGELIHCDLMFIKSPRNTNQNISIKGGDHTYHYILICVDTYSRFLWCYPLKDKSSSGVTEKIKEMISFIREVFYEGYDGLRINILTDAGKEFSVAINEIKNTRHIISKNPHGAVIAESYIYKIREKIRYLDDGRKKKISIDDLKALVENINSDGANDIIFNGVEPEPKLKKIEFKESAFKQGELVRLVNLEKINSTFVKKSALSNFSDNIFIISYVSFNPEQNIYRYNIATLDGEYASETLFYEESLVKVPFSYLKEEDIAENSKFTQEEIKILKLVKINEFL